MSRFAHSVGRYSRAALMMAAAVIISPIPPAAAVDSNAPGSVDIIISKLPPPGSDAYAALKSASGAAHGQVLEMTKSEMWTVPADHIDALRAASGSAGAEIMILGGDWNRALAPAPEGRAMTTEQSAMMQDSMKQKGSMGVQMIELPDARMLEYALTKGMSGTGAAPPGATLILPLNDTLTVTAERTGLEKTDDGYIWRGTVAGTDDPVTLMWWPSGRLTGQVTTQGHVFAVKHMGGGMHGVVEMSSGDLPPEHAPMSAKLKKKMNMTEDPLVTKGDASMLRPAPAQKRPDRGNTKNLEDAQIEVSPLGTQNPDPVTAPPRDEATRPGTEFVEITLLVAYTRNAASHYTDIAKDLIALSVEEANGSFRSSGIGNVRLKLVHAYETSYRETGSHFDHVFSFADRGDGKMEEVHALRNKYEADLAVLVVDDANGCGLAAGVAPEADRAFAAVHHACAATTYSLAHEIGHLLGARHDLELDDSTEPFAFGHGFVHGKHWRTMMSYKESCDGCPRLPIWSNPDILIRGVPAGNELANNARVISMQAAKVARYR